MLILGLTGEMLFDRRLGFSGTPSELLPLELGQCEYERGSDGKMLNFFTSESVTSYALIDTQWSVFGAFSASLTIVESLLLRAGVLRAIANGPYHALIDTGALITVRVHLLILSDQSFYRA